MTEPVVDISNEDPLYWEKVLVESNLSVQQEEPIEVSEQLNELSDDAEDFEQSDDYQYQQDKGLIYHNITRTVEYLSGDHSALNDTNEELRGKTDGNEPFFEGHRIIKPRRGNRPCPDWAVDMSKQREILLKSFPKLATDAKQRRSAGRWARIIQLYYRSQMTHKQVALELNMTYKAIMSAIRSVSRVAEDMRANGTGKRTRKRAIRQASNGDGLNV